jgi:Zn-dependent protease
MQKRMRFFRNRRLVLVPGPVPVTVGPGGLAPGLALAGLFAEVSVRLGLPVAPAVVTGLLGGTASLVLHELGHAFAARTVTGVRPVGVSLIWLGAATRLEGRYERGLDQAKVAMAGPAVSFAIGVALSPFLFVPVPLGVRGALVMLAALNVGIGAVNLLPANPLDGYKALVGLLWFARGSEQAARRLIRRLAFTWAPVEVLGSGFLLVDRPVLGSLAVTMAVGLIGQRVFVARAKSEAHA